MSDKEKARKRLQISSKKYREGWDQTFKKKTPDAEASGALLEKCNENVTNSKEQCNDNRLQTSRGNDPQPASKVSA